MYPIKLFSEMSLAGWKQLLISGIFCCLLLATNLSFSGESNNNTSPCSIGFWKNRANEQNGLQKYYPDGEFDQLVSTAVNNSQGVFPNSPALLNSITSNGKLTPIERAQQQLAALLLNLAAGDPNFTTKLKKCSLKPCDVLEKNDKGQNACGGASTVQEALTFIFNNLNSNPNLANTCGDLINTGAIVDLCHSPKVCPTLQCPCWNTLTQTSLINEINSVTPTGAIVCQNLPPDLVRAVGGPINYNATADSTIPQFSCTRVNPSLGINVGIPNLTPAAALSCSNELSAIFSQITWCP